MYKRYLAASAIAAMAAASNAAMADIVPWGIEDSAAFTVNINNAATTESGDLSWKQDTTNTDKWSLTGAVTWWNSYGSITLDSASFDLDPVLSFGITATNNSNAPAPFSFVFSAPMDPGLTGPIRSHADMGITLTDHSGDGATLQARAGSPLLYPFDLAGFDEIPKNVDLGSAYLLNVLTGASTRTMVDLLSNDGSLVCTTACTTMAAELRFILSGGQDKVSFTGVVTQDVSEVPLPGALGLFGAGFASLVGFARRRRRPVPAATA
ncbi:MAG: PEP-CTERM sorting domain-containing protein [Pseudomonadota bacterium]